jgi:glycosyltransferase involved in cell wall biosynthesis
VDHLRDIIYKGWLKKVSVIIALTDGDAAEWKKINSHVCVIPDMVSLNPTPTYSDCEAKSIIFVGRFSTQKDIPSLLQIWDIVHQRHPDWQLNIYAGYGDESERLKSHVKGMGEGVVLHEPTSDIFDKYKENSMLLLTSRFEPFGLVLPEAMSCGLPVVSFDCPYGPAEIITDEEDGFLIKNRDVRAFADRVCQLIENPQLRKEMGQHAIASSQRYSANRIMPQWKQLFESMASHS